MVKGRDAKAFNSTVCSSSTTGIVRRLMQSAAVVWLLLLLLLRLLLQQQQQLLLLLLRCLCGSEYENASWIRARRRQQLSGCIFSNAAISETVKLPGIINRLCVDFFCFNWALSGYVVKCCTCWISIHIKVNAITASKLREEARNGARIVLNKQSRACGELPFSWKPQANPFIF